MERWTLPHLPDAGTQEQKWGDHEKSVISPMLNHVTCGGKRMCEQAHADC